MKWIDLRSDTVTRPTPGMRQVMMEAEVGDDVYGEDPTVNRLEALVAGMVGTEAAVFAASGTQSNLIGLLSHCQRGDEYIVGQQAHTYRYEGGGAAVLGSIQPQPLDFEKDGSLDLEKVGAVIKPDDVHFARTRLLCLENTQAGKVLPLSYLEKAVSFARQRGLGLHLDGARLFNAAVKLGVPPQTIVQGFDTLSICLSKGLGAPVGSLLCGRRKLVSRARRWRKLLGGGMRQAGILAAAGIYALENNIDRLAEDHRNAAFLARGLAGIEGLSVDRDAVQTNMVFVSLDKSRDASFQAYMKDRGILVSGHGTYRLVTHLDISAKDIDTAVQAFRDFFARQESGTV